MWCHSILYRLSLPHHLNFHSIFTCVVLYYKGIEKAMITVIAFTEYKILYSLPLNSKSGLSIYYYFDNESDSFNSSHYSE